VQRDQRQQARRSPKTTSPRPRPPSRPVAHARIARRRRVGVVGLFALASLLVVLLTPLAGRSARGSVTGAHAGAGSAGLRAGSANSSGAGPLTHWSLWRAIAARPTRACQPASGPSDYVNPLAGARVRAERIDQGVDYAGSGALVAIGGAMVTDVTTTDTGWPGAFIEYRLLDGPDAGCYVYYAEGVNPAAGLRIGQTVSAGQPIASIIRGWPTGI
jgi:murein DD-endopeptidase MepM/ murein hydrolase activator NlpD